MKDMADRKARTLKLLSLAALLALAPPAAPAVADGDPPADPMQETCFFDRDYTSGFNRVCLYDCLSGQVAITISSLEICPLTIRR